MKMYKFILVLFYIMFIRLDNASSIIDDEVGRDRIVGIKAFGKFENDTVDLDSINENLANHEVKISKQLRAEDRRNRNNIVLAAITLIVRQNDGKKRSITKYIQIPTEERDKLKVFESRCSHNNLNTKSPNEINTLTDYSFEGTLVTFPEVSNHVNKIWGASKEELLTTNWKKKNDLLPRENQIWKEFQALRRQVWQQKEELKICFSKQLSHPLLKKFLH